MLGTRVGGWRLTVAALCFLLDGCMGLYLDEITPPHTGCRMCQGRYRVTIRKCPKCVDRQVVATALKERMGRALVHVKVGDDGLATASSASRDDKQVFVSIDSSAEAHWVWPSILVLPWLSSCGIIPMSGTVSWNLRVDLSVGGRHASEGLQFDRTIVFSSLPWPCLPFLWHDDGFSLTAFDDDAGTSRETRRLEEWASRWVCERLAGAIAASLEAFEKGSLAVQDVERMDK